MADVYSLVSFKMNSTEQVEYSIGTLNKHGQSSFITKRIVYVRSIYKNEYPPVTTVT